MDPLLRRHTVVVLTVWMLDLLNPARAHSADASIYFVERAVAMWNRPVPISSGRQDDGDLVRWETDHPADDIFAFDHVLHLTGRQDVLGSAGPRFLVAEYRTAFPDMVLTPGEPSTYGDRLVVRWTLRGTSLGPFADLEPTGQPHQENGSFGFRIDGNRIAETWVEANTAEVLREAGAGFDSVPTPCLLRQS